MGQEITLSKEHYGELDEFRPELFRRDMAQIRSISDVALRDLRKEQKALAADIEAMVLDPDTAEALRLELRNRHQEVLSRIAHFRAIHVTKAVAYYDANIQERGGDFFAGAERDERGKVISAPTDGRTGKSAQQLESELGFSDTTIRSWRADLRKAEADSDDPDKLHAEAYAEQLVAAWFKSTGLTEKKERVSSGPRQPVEDPEDKDEAWAHEMLAEYIDGTPRGQHMFLDLLAKHRKASDPFKRY